MRGVGEGMASYGPLEKGTLVARNLPTFSGFSLLFKFRVCEFEMCRVQIGICDTVMHKREALPGMKYVLPKGAYLKDFLLD